MNDTPTSDQQPTTVPGSLGRAFADAWSGTLISDIATLLNCEEVDALAGLLRALGADQSADEWISAHASADNEPQDSHYRDPNDPATVSADAFRWHPGLEEV
ncbi:hypothetical protein [Streptomyces tauricus]|uniref:hypothetical protein n=1 Tax=Streptomyces tauricus TaxID=68274 RepID=UPI0022447993|nr:hypothetical protein [Streptomyces tauricus]MCW8101641.1 hypothetical protein [Streptomyces tauricus]